MSWLCDIDVFIHLYNQVGLTHKQLDVHGYALSTVATDNLMLKDLGPNSI